jgi:hypothetical protein
MTDRYEDPLPVLRVGVEGLESAPHAEAFPEWEAIAPRVVTPMARLYKGMRVRYASGRDRRVASA